MKRREIVAPESAERRDAVAAHTAQPANDVRAEGAVSRKERLLRLALDSARVGSWEWDIVDDRIEVSEWVAPLFGVGDGAFARTLEGVLACVHEDDRPRVREALAGNLRGTAERYEIEYRVVWPDGSIHWVEAKGFTHRDASGRAVVMAGTVADIDRRKQAEEKRIASEALLRQLIAHTPAAIAMFDRDMRYLQVSERWLTDYHLEGQSLLGRSHYEVFPDAPERWKEIHQRVLGGAIERCDEDPFPRADGTLEWLQWEVRPWRQADGEIAGVIMLTQVITARKRAAATLRASEARLRRVIASPIVGIAFADAGGTITEANDEFLRILGATRDDVSERSIDLRTALPEDLHEADEPDSTRTRELELVRRDGTRVSVLFGRSAIDDAHSQVVFAFDLSERRELERRLEDAQRMEAVGRLAAGVAHDFNNVLAAITMSCDLLRNQLEPAHRGLDEAREIRKAAERATRLIRQLLAFSRQSVFDAHVLDLHELVAHLEKFLRRLLGDSIRMVMRVALPSARVKADPGQLEQVIINLVVNARDAMPRGGTLTLELAECELSVAQQTALELAAGRYLTLSVTDTGVGMDARTKARIFEPFFTTKEPGKGTGLGLPTVYGIIRQSGGAIEVASELGCGSTFRIYLPRVNAPIVRAPRSSRPEPSEGSETVLVVEDDATIRQLTRKFLVGLGYRVLEAAEPSAAVALARVYVGAIDLLLTDVRMPGGSGPVLAHVLMGLRPKLKVLYMSGSIELMQNEALLDTRNAFIRKPFASEDLARKVRQILDDV